MNTNRDEIRAECEERAFAVVEYTWGHDDREYFRPMTKHGYPDFALMVDIIGVEPAIMYETESLRGGKVHRCLVTEMTDNHIDFMEGYEIERSGWKHVDYLKSDTALPKHNGFPWSNVIEDNYVSPSIDSHGGVRHKWHQFLDGRLRIIGHMFALQAESTEDLSG
jgi:hypothetical protein